MEVIETTEVDEVNQLADVLRPGNSLLRTLVSSRFLNFDFANNEMLR